jgi:putative nucleotidyltransferase with HDIG domain
LREDGLRIIRAVRFHVELGFPIDPETEKAILENKEILGKVSRERVRDELVKIIMSDRPMDGFQICRKLGLIHYLIPELEETFDIEQNQAHAYDVWTHLLKSLQHSADKKYPLHVRLAALLHDISKPYTRRFSEETKQWTFYGHEVVGSRVTKKILEDLRLSRETIEKVTNLVRWHMFFSDTESITLSAVRRLVAHVGKENIWDLIDVRLCDRIGTGRPKENPYRLRKYQSMIEQVMRDPVSVGMLKIDGKRLMEVNGMNPGPRVGYILHALLEEVLENPDLNTPEHLEKKAQELNQLTDEDLKSLGQKGKEKMAEIEDEILREIKDRHKVQ